MNRRRSTWHPISQPCARVYETAPPRSVIAPFVRLSPFVFLVFLMIPAGCSPVSRSNGVVEPPDEHHPTSESWDVRFVISETVEEVGESRPRLVMEAGYMATFDDDSTFTVLRPDVEEGESDVLAVIFDPSRGDTSAVVRAHEIVYREAEGIFDATGDVRVEARDDRRLWSDRLHWDERERQIRAPGFVRIISPSERIEGYNMVSDEDLDNYRLERVTGEAEIEEASGADEPTVIRDPEDRQEVR